MQLLIYQFHNASLTLSPPCLPFLSFQIKENPDGVQVLQNDTKVQ